MACDDAVWVYHREENENITFEKGCRLIVTACQKVDKRVHAVGRRSMAWNNPRCHDYFLLGLEVEGPVIMTGVERKETLDGRLMLLAFSSADR